jgi:hypothetical protein
MGPPSNGSNKNTDCVLFFGDSFTFGEGVNDDEALPYLVGQQSGGQYHTYNFGFHGYGPHQMLAMLEYRLEEKIINCKPRFAVYQAILDHLIRAAGQAAWDTHGPRYVLERDGRVTFAGHFDDVRGVFDDIGDNALVSRVTYHLKKSLLFQEIFGHPGQPTRRRKVQGDDITLFLGIVDFTRNIFESRYPGGEFHVIFWDDKDLSHENDKESGSCETCNAVIEGLYGRGIKVHVISDILTDYHSDKQKYRISHETHPNALAYRLIATYLTEDILRK